MAEILKVTGVQKWDMIAEDTGERVFGSRAFIESDEVLDTKDKKGVFPTIFTTNGDQSLFALFPTVPAYYAVDFAMKVGSKGQFKVTNAELVDKE